MCHYCGCRELPLLRDYIAEHERAMDHGGEAVRALDRGEHERARELLTAMADELRSPLARRGERALRGDA